MKKLFSWKYSEPSLSLGLLLLRLTMGGLMIKHGYDKLVNFATMSKQFGDPIGIGSTPSLALVIFAEFFCAILVALGLLTRLACFALIICMGVAFFIGHKGVLYGPQGGEMAALYFGGYLAILAAGPGKFSADRLIGK